MEPTLGRGKSCLSFLIVHFICGHLNKANTVEFGLILLIVHFICGHLNKANTIELGLILLKDKARQSTIAQFKIKVGEKLEKTETFHLYNASSLQLMLLRDQIR